MIDASCVVETKFFSLWKCSLLQSFTFFPPSESYEGLYLFRNKCIMYTLIAH